MRIAPFALIALLLFAIVGCAPNAAAPLTAKKTGTFRVGFPTAPDPADVPILLAYDSLRAQGYTVQQTDFANTDLEVAAIARGDVDISHGSTRTHWAAAGKGAEILTLMQQAANEWALVTRADMKTCADLNDKRFGVQSAGSMSNALLQAYVKLYCPDIVPQVVYMPGSDIRAVALQSGNLDGTLVEIAEQLELEKQSPGKFPILILYSDAIPKVKTTGIYATSAFAKAHPEMVRDYLRAVLEVYRNLNKDPQLLYAALTKHAKMSPEQAKQVGDIYLARHIWDGNGGMNAEDVKYSLDFFVQTGSIPAGVDPTKIADFTFLDAVLQEIGKQ